MCGIAGIAAFNEKGKLAFPAMKAAIGCLNHRGPDANGIFSHNRVTLGHTRLSIIDTSSLASQPMTDASGRFTIVFNGEFFNFREHRPFVEEHGFNLISESDTEVLLYLYILEKEKCLHRVNGFFAMAIYDREDGSIFLARDRFGVKPLLVYHDEDKLTFASEMKALMAMGIRKETDEISLFTYLQLNYIPGPDSIFKRVKKLQPGHFLTVNPGDPNPVIKETAYYQLPFPGKETSFNSSSYSDQQKKLTALLDASVQRRLISDVPLGAFLSGGIDSSVIAALAARHTQHLKTFSIGFRDEPMFDETHYANLVAKKCGTDHTVFSLTNDDLFGCLFDVLDYLDEPFADSSALAVYILSKHTRKHVTVALSGDGADELFGGYNKHAAELKMTTKAFAANAIRLLGPFWKILPQSRESKFGNKIRQLNRFATGANQSAKDRYWRWAAIEDEPSADLLLKEKILSNRMRGENYIKRKNSHLKFIDDKSDLNAVLYTDVLMPLPGDMLTKVDLMSMANSLEVRTPFLDYEVVNFAFSIPLSSKIDSTGRKKIVRDAFRTLLPEELYTRHKQGFEVPLLKWFRHELKSLITDDLLSEKLIREQDLFDYEAISALKQKLFSSNPGDSAARIWALLVFQYWWKRNLSGTLLQS